jgi:hypothetical protein
MKEIDRSKLLDFSDTPVIIKIVNAKKSNKPKIFVNSVLWPSNEYFLFEYGVNSYPTAFGTKYEHSGSDHVTLGLDGVFFKFRIAGYQYEE